LGRWSESSGGGGREGRGADFESGAKDGGGGGGGGWTRGGGGGRSLIRAGVEESGTAVAVCGQARSMAGSGDEGSGDGCGATGPVGEGVSRGMILPQNPPLLLSSVGRRARDAGSSAAAAMRADVTGDFRGRRPCETVVGLAMRK
jgi:hypothetical protein